MGGGWLKNKLLDYIIIVLTLKKEDMTIVRIRGLPT